MSKAFKCDNCLELFEGEPALTENGKDICNNCIRVVKILNKVDPFTNCISEPLLNMDEFTERFCKHCGSQRCEGIGTEWWVACKYAKRLKTE